MNSTIFLRNDLAAPVSVRAQVTPTLDAAYWGVLHPGVAEEQTASLFWASRQAGIPDGASFTFTAEASIAGVTISLMVRLTGTLLGSDIAVAVQADAEVSAWSPDATVTLGFSGADGKAYRVTGAYVSEGAQYDSVEFRVSEAVLPAISHVVVLMLENRSFDNLLGWLYDDRTKPARFIPAGSAAVFNGLATGSYSNSDPGVNGGSPVSAMRGTTGAVVNGKPVPPLCVPDPDPGEEFSHCQAQIGGGMAGFLADYVAAVNQAGGPPAGAAQIMQAFTPEQVPVISQIARQFAVCDAWHASVPSQTWPNRAFVQAGASAGQVNNTAWPWDIPTVFDVLDRAGISWRVFNDGTLPSLTRTMFLGKYLDNQTNFGGIDAFRAACADGSLPAFTFLEPSFGPYGPDESYHPPYDVTPGEVFLAKIYDMLRTSPARDETLFVILFDEHGGTYDHVTPPAAPQALPPATDGSGFRFDRFGVRVPAIVVSSFTSAGTVFRSATGVPYDHTSILATLRDWLGLGTEFRTGLPSARIATAPTLVPVLDLPAPRPWPELAAVPTPMALAALTAPGDDVRLNDNQKAILMALSARAAKRPLSLAEKRSALAELQNHGDARTWMSALMPHLPAPAKPAGAPIPARPAPRA